jgi:Coenzyme PQQ synthesis protein D (PqqD)
MRPRRRPDLTMREIDGEVLILDRRAGRIHQLNRTASYIWDRCDGAVTVDEIARDLVRVFDVDPGRASADVAATVAQLHERSLLEL